MEFQIGSKIYTLSQVADDTVGMLKGMKAITYAF